jgi:hypothetical protein
MEVLRAEQTRVVGPSPSRRLVLLLAAGTASALVAYRFPDVVLWNHAAFLAFGISFLAGFSALWSP